MQPQESSIGPVVATIIILAVVVLGGLYFWGQHKGTPAPAPTTSSDTSTVGIDAQSSSDTTTSIQGDLQNTNTNVGTELNAS